MSRRVAIGSPLDCVLVTTKLEAARAAYEAAVTALHEAVANYTESHVAAYSIAHPKRRVEFIGSMGRTSLTVDSTLKEYGAHPSAKTFSFYGDTERLAGGTREINSPEFMRVISAQEDETGINGLSQYLGHAIYKNGKKIKK